MAIRQYIGARYVPRFTGLYDATQIYEALDVVDNGAGTSYIAKKTVPAGTPLTNTDYWFIYGASSGAIINLQNQIGDLTALDTTDKDSLVDAVNENVAAIADNKKLITKRRIVFVGDSYAQGYSPDGDTNPWPVIVADHFGLTAADYTIAAFGATGFAASPGGVNFITLLQGSSIADPETVTDVVVAGGFNDHNQNNNDILYGIRDFVGVSKTKYPNARIHIGFVARSRGTDRQALAIKRCIYIAGAAKYGCHYMNNAEYSLCDYYAHFSSDGFHPNQTGQNAIADAVGICITNGSVDIVKAYEAITITSPIGTITTDSANGLGQTFNNGFVTLYALSKLKIQFTNPVNYGAATGRIKLNIGTMDNGFIYGNNYHAPIITVQCMAQTGASEFITCQGTLSFDSGHVDLTLQSTSDGHNSWRTISSLYSVEIMAFEAVLDANFV